MALQEEGGEKKPTTLPFVTVPKKARLIHTDLISAANKPKRLLSQANTSSKIKFKLYGSQVRKLSSIDPFISPTRSEQSGGRPLPLDERRSVIGGVSTCVCYGCSSQQRRLRNVGICLRPSKNVWGALQ